MIQRVQSFFLFLIAGAMFSIAFLPLWEKTSIDNTDSPLQYIQLDALKMDYYVGGELKSSTQTFYISIAAFLSSVIALGSLFSYKSRLRQLKLNLLNVLLMIGALGTSIYFIFEGTKLFEIQNQGRFGYGFYMPIAGLLFNLIANRFIRKDEKLVKSIDRIR